MTGAVDRRPIERFLVERGADRVPHVGGSLYDHLRRVANLLRDWGAEPEVEVAGLCHACYGTDAFGPSLIGTADRAALAALIGSRAEALVYLYGSCDRSAVYPRLGAEEPVPFRDRFTGETHTAAEPDLRAFLEMTAANELDVLAHDAALAERYGASLLGLFTRTRDRLSAAAWRACAEALGPAPA
jgi:hypothetical protein